MSSSLEPLLADGVIDAVIGQLKAGKEAEVWLVQQAERVIAAKVYKERHARNFRNNAGYLEGRDVRNSRTRRAMANGSRFGQAASEDAWKSAEADALYKLHALEVRVPGPVMFYEGVLLMELVLDAQGSPAPRLVEAPPSNAQEAQALYLDLRQQIIRMLAADLIHGDLSPYNILMAECGPTVIDFPQTIAAAANNRAEMYFRRDLENVREFLARYDGRLNGAAGDASEIWNAYVKRELTPDFVPTGRHAGRPPQQQKRGQPRDENRRREGLAADRRPRDPRPNPPEQRAHATPVLDPVEAELRDIEARFLRQGGGDRGKPFVPAADARNGGFNRGRGPNRGNGQNRGGPQNRSGPPSRGGAPNRSGPPNRNGAPDRSASGASPNRSGSPNRGGAPDRSAAGSPNRGGAPNRSASEASPNRGGAPDRSAAGASPNREGNRPRGGAPNRGQGPNRTGASAPSNGTSNRAGEANRGAGPGRAASPNPRAQQGRGPKPQRKAAAPAPRVEYRPGLGSTSSTDRRRT